MSLTVILQFCLLLPMGSWSFEPPQLSGKELVSMVTYCRLSAKSETDGYKDIAPN